MFKNNGGFKFFIWLVTLLLVASWMNVVEAEFFKGFNEVKCKGTYEEKMFARLDRVCEDCYNLHREPQLYTLCRQDCFTSDYFIGCVEVLTLDEEKEVFKSYIKQLHGAEV